jgi:hypothetical protein
VTLGGNEMESEEMKERTPKGKDREFRKAWGRFLVVANGCQEIRTTTKNGVPARDTRTSRTYMYNDRWTSKLSSMSLIAAVNNNVYQQENKY